MALIFGGCLCLEHTAIAEDAASVPAKDMRALHASTAAPVDFATIVERYGPAVVHIRAKQQASMPSPKGIGPGDPFFAFFGRPAPQSQEPEGSPPRVIWGVGSGFIVSPDGLALTTAHVVNRADEVTVRLPDRREFKAKVVAIEPQSDLAMLQIEAATKLPVVKLGDSSRVRVGEQVLTIGSPDGSGNTATTGIVSATSHTLPDGTTFPFFQTDIAVSPDNSGGPLFNRAGEVIGIDVQIYTGAERYHSLTFAIPVTAAIKLRARSQAKGSRGDLGIEVQDVSPGLAAAFGLPRPAGALVNSVEPRARGTSPAFKPGDVITQIGDKMIEHSVDLTEFVAGLEPGTKITLKVVRNRKPITMPVVVGASEEKPIAQQEGLNAIDAVDRLGLVLHPLSESEQRSSGLAGGLMVDASSGPAASAGIQPGDIVLSVNDTLVTSREELGASLAKAAKEIALLIQRDNVRRFVSVEVK